jgi:hypothetical protein
MKFSVKCNQWDNWYGYAGGRRVEAFANDSQGSQEQHAHAWVLARYREAVESAYSARLDSLRTGHSRTVVQVDTQDPGFAAALLNAAEDRTLAVQAVAIEKGRAARQAWIRVTVYAKGRGLTW